MAHSAASFEARFGTPAGGACRALFGRDDDDDRKESDEQVFSASQGAFPSTPTRKRGGAAHSGLTPFFQRTFLSPPAPAAAAAAAFHEELLFTPASDKVRELVINTPVFQRNAIRYEEQALKMARFARSCSPSDRKSPPKLIARYLWNPKVTVTQELFVSELFKELSTFKNTGENARKELVVRFASRANTLKENSEEGSLPKRFTNACLDLVETNDLFLLTSILYAFKKEYKREDVDLPRTLVVDKPIGASYPWLYCSSEAEVVRFLLENPEMREQTDLKVFFENMIENPEVKNEVLELALTHFLLHLRFNQNTPILCHIDKINDLKLARKLVSSRGFDLRAARYPKFKNMQNNILRMHVWDPSHVFEPKLKEGKPSGYHVLKSHDVHVEERGNATILVRDPIIQEGPMLISFYEMQYCNEAGVYRRQNKLSTYYRNMDEETLANSIFTILAQPVNDPHQMRRANELVYYGYHLDSMGEKVMSQLYVNIIDDIPHIITCFPIPYRQIQEKQLIAALPPQSPPPKPRMVRRDSNGLHTCSPLKGQAHSPSKQLASSVRQGVSPWKKKRGPKNPIQRIDALKGKVARLLEKLDTLPSSDPDFAIIKLKYASIRGMRSTREMILSAAHQVPSPKVANQKINLIKPVEAPAGYSDVQTVVIVPMSELIEIANEALA